MNNRFNNQFDDLSVPNPKKYYYYSDNFGGTGFTHLMKLVLVIKQYPKANEMLREIIKNNPSELDKQTNEGYTALMIAGLHLNTLCDEKTVKILIKSCTDVNIKNGTSGRTALMYVLEKFNKKSNIEIVRMLINAGADVNIQDKYESIALTIACGNKKCNAETVKLLIDAGADINIRCNTAKYTALMHACNNSSKTGKVDIIKTLINAGANVNIINNHSGSALDFLFDSRFGEGNFESIKILIDAGADIKRYYHSSPILMIASNHPNNIMSMQSIDYLIKSGADINA